MSRCALVVVLLSAFANPLLRAGDTGAEVPPAVYAWFEYTGDDPIFETPLPAQSFRNPILPGFHPDPSICRVGSDYYLVNSTFAYFPGVPIFHSRDLVHWSPLGHVLDRASQLDLDGLPVSSGIFAPTIRFHDGTYYMITTLVGGGGNFFVTASDPAGPWSAPVWLKTIDGIDPSFFFDDDGRAYIVNNGPPPDDISLYSGHRAIWLQEYDLAKKSLVGRRELLVNGGTDLARQPIWIEGPHLFKRGGWYYLVCAEGGTDVNHSEVVFRSRQVRGPYEPWERNPILTQRNLPASREHPVTSTGHADFVTTPDGSWWAVFLGCRPYEDDFYNTGRETFLLPVRWNEEGWPTILEPGRPVPSIVPAPDLPASGGHDGALPQGNFTWRDDFDATELNFAWNYLRTPRETWLSLSDQPGNLTLEPRLATLRDPENPSFIGYRQQHAHFTATIALRPPPVEHQSIGLAAFQNEKHYYFLALRRRDSALEVFLERPGEKLADGPEEVARSNPIAAPPELMQLRIEGEGGRYAFYYSMQPGNWTLLQGGVDGTFLSTKVAGGFVGTYLGPHARIEP